MMNAYQPKTKSLASIFPAPLPSTISADFLICDVQTDSREVSPGSLFIALAGIEGDGEKYISHAVENGAVAIVVEEGHQAQLPDVEVPIIPLKNVKTQVSMIAANFYQTRSHSLCLFGVTGTNGKSTITSLIAQLYTLMGNAGAVVGTLGYGFVNEMISTGMTTPDVVKCHRILAELKDAGASVVAMEVSSHGIHQGRIGELTFDVGVLSNITHDHLDYHGSFKAYAEVKKSFLRSDKCRACVINADDAEAKNLIGELKQNNKSCIGYGVDNAHADVSAKILKRTTQGFEVEIASPWGRAAAVVPLVGRFNLGNVLAAVSAACLAGADFKRVCEQVAKLRAVDGRLQNIAMDSSTLIPQVYVDFAHTPDALLRVIEALKEHLGGHLWVVFGCGGDRDRTKRGKMGAIAASMADHVIVTSDNPRTENPQAILDEIVDGVMKENIANAASIDKILDRRKAINKAIRSCAAEDTILIAGKGHEDYQIIGTQKFPFSDALVALKACRARAKSQQVAQ